jgi:hypothetical protein
VELDLKWKTDLRTELERSSLEVDEPLMLESYTIFKDSNVNVINTDGILNFKGMVNAIQGQAINGEFKAGVSQFGSEEQMEERLESVNSESRT